MRRVDEAYRALAARAPRPHRRRSTAHGRPTRSQRRFVSTFARFSEHPEAGRLLDAALREGPAHAYLFHGPPGVGKREVARTFARSLLGTDREFHPDLYELDALGEMIRIDAIRELRRDLHMRPFEADRRVYLDPARAPAERGRGRRAAEGPRGAAALRRDRARRRRPRADPRDDPLALPARAVPPAVGAGDPRARRRARARARRRGAGGTRARRRRPARPARARCSTRRRAIGATR